MDNKQQHDQRFEAAVIAHEKACIKFRDLVCVPLDSVDPSILMNAFNVVLLKQKELTRARVESQAAFFRSHISRFLKGMPAPTEVEKDRQIKALRHHIIKGADKEGYDLDFLARLDAGLETDNGWRKL